MDDKKQFENVNFSAFNANDIGYSSTQKEKNRDIGDFTAEEIGNLKLFGANKEKAYRLTIYKLGGILLLNKAIVFCLSLITGYFLNLFNIPLNNSSDFSYVMIWFVNSLLTYAVPAVILYFVFRYTAPDSFETHRGFKRFMLLPVFLSAYFVMNAGVYITDLIINLIYQGSAAGELGNVYSAVLPSNTFQVAVYYLMITIIAPIAEEYIYRKMMLNPLREYGDLSAILLTALIFALFHGNGVQFLYTFFCGIILGFAAVWTGNVIAPIILHIMINAFEVISGDLRQLAMTDIIPLSPETLNLIIYILFILGAASLVFMIFSGMFRLKNTCPEITNRRKAGIILVNPLLILSIAIIIIQMFV